jgi:hypothetical protein
MNGYSNLTIDSDLHVQGDVFRTGRVDVGTTIHATFRLTSNEILLKALRLPS